MSVWNQLTAGTMCFGVMAGTGGGEGLAKHRADLGAVNDSTET